MRYLVQTAWELRESGHPPVDQRVKEALPLPKHQSASNAPTHHRQLYRAHEHAIYLNSAWSMMRGYAMFFGCTALALSGSFLYVAHKLFNHQDLLDALNRRPGWLINFAVLAGLLLIVNIGLFFFIRAVRLDLLSPVRIPLVFNRKTRKVYKFVPDAPELSLSLSAVLTNFKPWGLLLIEYDWDCLEAEYLEQTVLNGNSVKTLRILQLYAKEHPTSNNVIGGLLLTSPMLVGKEAALDFWEYIRRYMEEDGPIMGARDEPAPPLPTNIIQSSRLMLPYMWPLVWLGAAGCFYFYWGTGGPLKYFGDYSAIMFIVGILSLVGVVAMTSNWLAHRLAPDLPLPEEVLKDAGPELDLQQLYKSAKVQVKNSAGV